MFLVDRERESYIRNVFPEIPPTEELINDNKLPSSYRAFFLSTFAHWPTEEEKEDFIINHESYEEGWLTFYKGLYKYDVYKYEEDYCSKEGRFYQFTSLIEYEECCLKSIRGIEVPSLYIPKLGVIIEESYDLMRLVLLRAGYSLASFKTLADESRLFLIFPSS